MTAELALPASPPARQRGPLDDVQLHTVDNLEALWACQRWAGERRDGPLAFDTESGGLNPHTDAWRLIQLGDTRHGWAAPVTGWGGGMIELLTGYQGDLLAHNSPYDWRVLAVAGVAPQWHKTHDTLLGGHLVHSLRLAALKPRAAIEIDPRAVIGDRILHEAMTANGWDWATVPIDLPAYLAYSALDPVLSAHLYAKFAPELDGRYRVPYDMERATGRICANMMMAGMMIDIPFINAKITELNAECQHAMMRLRTQHGVTSVNSSEQVGRALNAAGVPTMKWTKGGRPSVDKDALKLYRNLFPHAAGLIDLVTRAKKTDAIVHRHLMKFLSMADSGSIIHPSIWSCRARTSRMSVTDPAMQTFDRDEPVIRGAYVPRPGCVFVTVDADQIEARLGACFGQDAAMIDMFRHAEQSPYSFFRLMASQIFRQHPDDIPKSDPRYTLAKNTTYGKIYGSGEETMAATAGVTVEQIRPIRGMFDAYYPGITRLMNSIVSRAKADVRSGGYPHIETPLGRQLRGEPGKEYALTNYLIQAHAAEILKMGLIKLDAAGLGPYMRLPIHDEIVLEVPKEHGQECLDLVVRLLTDRETYPVPITWQGSILEERWRKT